MDLITATQARLVASSAFHAQRRNGRKPVLVGSKTNRKGAWFYRGDQKRGFIIDGRCLSPEEHAALSLYAKPHKAVEYREPASGKIEAFINPLRQTSRNIFLRMRWSREEVDLFVLYSEQYWCLAQIFCGITTADGPDPDPLANFAKYHAPSNHALIEAQAILSTTRPSEILAQAT